MAKKSGSRPTKKAAGQTAKPIEPAEEPVVEAEIVPVNQPRTPRAAGKPRISRAQATIEQLKDEYSYVTKDLRNVFILAAAMFALLIALNLILPLFGI